MSPEQTPDQPQDELPQGQGLGDAVDGGRVGLLIANAIYAAVYGLREVPAGIDGVAGEAAALRTVGHRE